MSLFRSLTLGLTLCLKHASADPALVTSPSGNYAPVHGKCPEKLFVRSSGQGEAMLSPAELNYVNEKAAKSIPMWKEYLGRVKLKDFNVDDFLLKAQQKGGLPAETLPNFGFAMSGGGARALCFGGSILEAFDSRNDKGNTARVGGILQLANYVTAVSGGGWLTGSWATSNFPRISSLNWRLTEDNDLWDWNVAKHYPKVYKVVKMKKKAGFPVSIVDAWGRLVSRHFIDDPTNEDPKQGQGVLWSSIRQTSGYQTRAAPFVIAIATSRPNTKTDMTPDSPIYEFSPEEFGVFHPRFNASIPIEFMGSPPRSTGTQPDSCVQGFDNAGFVMAMSSNIFSAGDAPPNGKDRPLMVKLLDVFASDDDFEGKVPNTFQGMSKSTEFQDNDRETILMADCGLNHENVPLFPLIQPARKMDVIIAVDSTADGTDPEDPQTLSYPNGAALYSVYSKTLLPSYRGYRMPKIPNAEDGTFEKLGYNKRPTFFGCNASPDTPLIMYLPNYYAVGKTNINTKQSTYSQDQVDDFFENGFAIATQNAGPTQNEDWPSCAACLLIDRQVQRNMGNRTTECNKCFDRYCAKE